MYSGSSCPFLFTRELVDMFINDRATSPVGELSKLQAAQRVSQRLQHRISKSLPESTSRDCIQSSRARRIFSLSACNNTSRHAEETRFFRPSRWGWDNVRRFLEIGQTCYTGKKGCFSVNSMRDVAMLPEEGKRMITQNNACLKNS